MSAVFLAVMAALSFACVLCLWGEPLRMRKSSPGLVEGVRGLRPVCEWRARQDRATARHECLYEVPRMLDVLTLGLCAGLSFDASMELYNGRSKSLLARYLSEACMKWRLGVVSREQALFDIAEELDVVALRRFAGAVREALEFGAPLSKTLMRQADVLRDEQRLQVEEAIEKVPVKMLVPLGCLVMPAMLLSIMGPLLASAFSKM